MSLEVNLVNAEEKVFDINFENINEKVLDIDLSKLLWKLQDSEEGKNWDQATCNLAEQEYRRFLTLKIKHPGQSLVPNKLIDTIWHQHILDTASYREDCEKLFGYFMDHYPYFGMHGDEDQKSLQMTFEVTKKLYERHFGSSMEETVMRCADHPCHVPTSCACRSPEACK